MRTQVAIVGGGLAAARAIREYRAAGGSGSIALLSREQSLPYHRPPLSKRYLRGEVDREGTLVEPQQFYEENAVELLLGTEVTAVEPRERFVRTTDRRYGYDKLLIATGAQPRTLDVPGADLPGVFSLPSEPHVSSVGCPLTAMMRFTCGRRYGGCDAHHESALKVLHCPANGSIK